MNQYQEINIELLTYIQRCHQFQDNIPTFWFILNLTYTQGTVVYSVHVLVITMHCKYWRVELYTNNDSQSPKTKPNKCNSRLKRNEENMPCDTVFTSCLITTMHQFVDKWVNSPNKACIVSVFFMDWFEAHNL